MKKLACKRCGPPRRLETPFYPAVRHDGVLLGTQEGEEHDVFDPRFFCGVDRVEHIPLDIGDGGWAHEEELGDALEGGPVGLREGGVEPDALDLLVGADLLVRVPRGDADRASQLAEQSCPPSLRCPSRP